ncbi:MAG: GAF domain-containing protein [Anaerolineales bacterium]|nr:GAF domain-containing protein [Anaerolineales bacterium]
MPRSIKIAVALAAVAAALSGIRPLPATGRATNLGPGGLAETTLQQVAPAGQLDAALPTSLRFNHIGIDQGLSQSVVNCILQDRLGFLWIGTQDGLNRYDGHGVRIFRPNPDDPNSISDNWINALFQDRQGYLWIGTNHGLNRYDPQTGAFARYLHDPANPQSLVGNTVQVIFEDSLNRLWVGTDEGLDRFSNSRDGFIHYYTETFLPPDISSNNITAIYEDLQGSVWFGTATGGLNRYIRGVDGFIPYTHDPYNNSSLSSNTVNAIQGDSNGLLWIATDRGLDLLDPEVRHVSHYRHSSAVSSSLSDNNVQSLYIDHAGNVWVGTNAGLDLFERRTRQFIHYHHEPGNEHSLSANAISAIIEDSAGVVWIGTFGGGLNAYDHSQDRFTTYSHQPNNPNSLSGNIVFPIYCDPAGIIWIGTFGDGLNRFDPQTGVFTRYRYNPQDPTSLHNNEVWSLHMDRNGILWVGTSAGLAWLDPTSGQFTPEEGYREDDLRMTDNLIYAIHEDSDGIFWIGTNRGLYLLDPSSSTILAHYVARYDDPGFLSDNDVTVILEDSQGTIWLGTLNGGLDAFDPQTGTFQHYRSTSDNPLSLSDDTVLTIFEDSQGILWIGTSGGLNRYTRATDSFRYFLEFDGLPSNAIYGILEDPEGYLWLSTNNGLARFDLFTETFRNFAASDGLQSNEFDRNAYAIGLEGEMYFGGIGGFTTFDPLAIEDSNFIPPVILTALTQDGQPVEPNLQPEFLEQITLHWPDNHFEFEFAALSFAQPDRNQYAYFLEPFDDDWNYIGTRHNGRYTNLPGGEYTLHLIGSNHDGVWNDTGYSIAIIVVPPFWQTWGFRGLVALVVLGVAFGGYRLRIMSINARNRDLEQLVYDRTAALRRRNEEIEALYQADEQMLRSLTLEQVLQALIGVTGEMLHADKGLILIWNNTVNCWKVYLARGIAPETYEVIKCAREESVIAQVVESGEPVILQDIQNDPRWLENQPELIGILLTENVRSVIALPLRTGGIIPAIFIVGFFRPNSLTDEFQRLFMALVQRAALSIENTRLFEQAKELAVLEERNRLARDLHDSAKQKAFAALAQLGTANGVLKADAQAASSHLTEAENLVYEVIEELTFLIQEMYPMALAEKGLANTLREYIYEWENRNEATVDLRIEDERRVALEIEQALYRVVQEALANVSRHSQANRVEILLEYQDRSINVTITDNGRGFETCNKQNGMGLRSIRERVESIHGTFSIESQPGQGTRLHVQAPAES